MISPHLITVARQACSDICDAIDKHKVTRPSKWKVFPEPVDKDARLLVWRLIKTAHRVLEQTNPGDEDIAKLKELRTTISATIRRSNESD